MRIKAWDKVNKRFREIRVIDIENKGISFMDERPGDWTVCKLDRVHLVRSSGLRIDKTPIFLGDIIEFNDNIHERTGGFRESKIVKHHVVFESGAFWVNGTLLIDVLVNDEEAKIVGNIYENPELLEVAE